MGILMLPVLWPAGLVYYLLSLEMTLPLRRRVPDRLYWVYDVLAWSAVILYLFIVFNWDTLTG